jgi:pimeloyl-ACP methyl ester carboxylesterase
MSTTGDATVGQPTPDAMAALFTPPPTTRDQAVERAVFVFRTIGSEGELFDEAFVREMAGVSWDRNPSHDGVPRQLLAIAASGDRTERLRRLTVPALVIHGEHDPLVTPSGGAATAAAIPGARLITVPRMGHDLPRDFWPLFVDAIAEVAARATL